MAALIVIVPILYKSEIDAFEVDNMRIMGVIAVDTATIAQVALNVRHANIHDLHFVAHHPNRLHPYQTINILPEATKTGK